eukprot:2614739-Amphidinium_carterae.1
MAGVMTDAIRRGEEQGTQGSAQEFPAHEPHALMPGSTAVFQRMLRCFRRCMSRRAAWAGTSVSKSLEHQCKSDMLQGVPRTDCIAQVLLHCIRARGQQVTNDACIPPDVVSICKFLNAGGPGLLHAPLRFFVLNHQDFAFLIEQFMCQRAFNDLEAMAMSTMGAQLLFAVSSLFTWSGEDLSDSN